MAASGKLVLTRIYRQTPWPVNPPSKGSEYEARACEAVPPESGKLMLSLE
jgi:hypothetical protein